jgi:hypothetical protein
LIRAGRIWSPVINILLTPYDPPPSLALDILSRFRRCRGALSRFKSDLLKPKKKRYIEYIDMTFFIGLGGFEPPTP